MNVWWQLLILVPAFYLYHVAALWIIRGSPELTVWLLRFLYPPDGDPGTLVRCPRCPFCTTPACRGEDEEEEEA